MEKPYFEPVSRGERIDERNIDSFLCSIEPGFEKTLSFLTSASNGAGAARVDISETKDVYEFVFELAGVDESDIEVTVTSDTLSLRAERTSTPDDGRTWHHREHAPAKLARTILLPEGLDTDDVGMKLENGLLTVRISKAARDRRGSRLKRLHS